MEEKEHLSLRPSQGRNREVNDILLFLVQTAVVSFTTFRGTGAEIPAFQATGIVLVAIVETV